MSLLNLRALKTKQLTSKLAVAALFAGGLTVAPFFAGADGGYTVPAGADVIQVVAIGGSGGKISSAETGGKGCELSASFAVTEGDVFSEVLGGNGGNGSLGSASAFVMGGAGGAGAEGRNGGKGGDYEFLNTFRGAGSGGGGATSVYLNGTEVMISGGGGGGGTLEGGSGCAGNTLNGGSGLYGIGGGGATTSAPGVGGAARAGDGLAGQDGTLGVGGAGTDATLASNGMSSGGGGGYYGGGSSPTWAGCCSASGGGAGSSWAATPGSGIKAATGRPATVADAAVSYYAVDFPAQSLDNVTFGTAYSDDLSATFKGTELNNGTTAIWTVSPALPAGLTLNSANGTISGTATEQVSDDYVFKAAWKSGSDIIARSFQTIHLSVSTPPATPGSPVITSTNVVNTNVTLEWTPPTRIGDTAISDYIIEYSTDGGSTWTVYNDGVSLETSITLRNLQQLTDYQFRVTAVNNDGPGSASTPASATTALGVPGQVQITQVSASNTGIRLEWTAPEAGGAPITDYIVEYSPDGGETWFILDEGVGTNLDARIQNLDRGTKYLVRVAAVNELGTGDFSQPFEIKTGNGGLVTPTPTPTPTETESPSPTPTPTETVKPTPTPKPTPTKTAKPTPKPTSSPSSSATPSSSPSATALPSGILDVLAQPYKSKGSIIELKPLDSLALENGSNVPVKLIKKGTKDGYILDGSSFDLELAAADENLAPVELDENGHLVLQKDRYATFNGTGFAPNTPVQIWLFSTPTPLKRVVTDENGNFSGSALVPSDLESGEHTMQLNGVTEDGEIRSVSLGVIVQKSADTAPKASFDWSLVVLWTVSGLLIIALLWWFIAARRRKREDEQTA